MEYYRHTSAWSPGTVIRDICLLLLRAASSLALVYFHGWRNALEGWEFIWRKTDWPLLEVVTGHGFPWPVAVTIALVPAVLLCCAFLLLGILTRIGAGIMLGFTLVAAPLYPGYPDLLQAFTLYGVIFLVLVLAGPGHLSLDGLVARRRVRRRS